MSKQTTSKHDPTKQSKQVARRKKKNNNDWRHIPFIPEMIDQIHYHNPEDDMIAAIDGELMDEPFSFDAHEVYKQALEIMKKKVNKDGTLKTTSRIEMNMTMRKK